jgi:hypothetical protein
METKPEKRGKRRRKEQPASTNVEPISGPEKQQPEKNQSNRDRPAIWDGATWREEDGTPID